MKKLITFVLLLAWSMVNGQWSMAQIGTWKAYMAYSDIQEIQKAGDELFVMASNDLYQYNLNDQSIYTYDKANGLSDTDIRHIKWCPEAKRLIVVYQNSNIDLVETDGDIINISDLYTKAITGDKTVNSILIEGVYAYLICGFGIVKVNMERAEISDSYTPHHPEYPTDLPAEDNSDYDKYIELVKTLNPGGPKYNYFGYMKLFNDNLYTANGNYNHGVPIQVLEMSNKEWTIYQHEGISETTGVSYTGSFCFDIDPSNQNHVLAGSRNGLYEYINGQFTQYYDHNNSPIEPFDGKEKEYQIVTGVQFDQEGNVWILNSSAPNTALVKLSNGYFTKLNHKELMKLNTNSSIPNRSNAELCKMMFDSQGTMWFCNNNWTVPALYQYNTQTDAIIAYESFINQDGMDVAVGGGVRCVVEDLEKNIWIGTNVGPLVLERTEINDEGTVFTQIKVPRNDGTDYADYLLSGIDILSIAIDKAGRKWFGTNGNGVYLISADNMTQVQHFTTENSPLLSDIVMSIVIHSSSGEVFFGTDKGLCSYMSDATTPSESMEKDNVWAYPNPVTPEYTGLITITGLTYNADVKITNAAGFLITEGRSNGGLFTWDGKDKKGNRVASGIYNVITATNDGKKGTVCKIAIVN
ncbi:hypothetical protein [Prevotella sp. tf2-5]|uniref:type IX secretion system anionic LPS delivery protein PorZ n=1 Tax=Prevotella sp. tf2-5 TaxID=1761889 RepID=UPI0008F13893|nr:hypothetical protein [Prevotella sp. tf2-5]SFO69589.1 hypothetical protein SAMN04487852_105124 [Prevotella sp. tf2-5]